MWRRIVKGTVCSRQQAGLDSNGQKRWTTPQCKSTACSRQHLKLASRGETQMRRAMMPFVKQYLGKLE